MKHIILGDVHLSKGINIGKPGNNKVLNSRVQDQLDLLYYTVDLALEKDCKHIIITGDIYQDPRPHPMIINLFMKWLKYCEKKSVFVDIIAGNHDILRTGSYTVSALDLVPTVECKNAVIHKSIACYENDNVKFVFIPFRDKRMYEVIDSKSAIKKLIEEVTSVTKPDKSKTNFIVGHLSLEGCLEIGDEISDTLHEIFIPLDTFPDYDYMIMGHIHHPQILQKENPYCAHIGSMERSDFHANEITRDKILIMFDDVEKSIKHYTLPNRKLSHIKIDVPADKDSTDVVINTLAVLNSSDPLKDSIVRIDIQLLGAELLNVERTKIEDYVYNTLKAHHICKISESRILNVKANESAKDFNSEKDIRSSLKHWTSFQEFETEEEEMMFIQFSNEIVDEYEEKL